VIVAKVGLAALVWVFAATACWSQGASSPPVSAPAPPASPVAPDQPAQGQGGAAREPARQDNPGLLGEMGKMFEKSLSILPTLKSTSDTLEDLNTRAKDAAKDAVKDAGDSLARLARPSSVASGREKCPLSPNGAPDCKVAADKLCLAKGFKEGKSLTMDSVEACSPKVLIPGRQRKPDDCRTDNYVTRALCQ
jgi:hypothetical protein